MAPKGIGLEPLHLVFCITWLGRRLRRVKLALVGHVSRLTAAEARTYFPQVVALFFGEPGETRDNGVVEGRRTLGRGA